ncbi:MAG: outer membrane lipid asymmetry maintenance protein MlaD [gamma proteobacterium symbiont of Bathyaustriella thionipta]|nr:outer membrane lipid asymmetry maintenance protein MlaD [gamma proteobacterium symbiont of Bathyaustriella thionipta]
MHNRGIELAVGTFMAIGLVALFFLAMKVGNLSGFSSADNYSLSARFENIGGLKVRSPVKMAGVRIGEVTDIGFDRQTFEAVVTLDIQPQFDTLPADTIASIYTSGLLGEQYIGLDAGGDEEVLHDGDQLELTQSAIVLEQLIGQFLFSKADEGVKDEGGF